MFVWISNSTSSVAQQVSGQQVSGQQLSGQQLQNGQSTDLNFSFPDTLQRQYVDDYFYVDLLLNGTEDSLTGGSVTFTFDPSIVRYEGVSFGAGTAGSSGNVDVSQAPSTIWPSQNVLDGVMDSFLYTSGDGGMVQVDFVTLGDGETPTASAPGTFMRIFFTALQSGVTDVDLIAEMVGGDLIGNTNPMVSLDGGDSGDFAYLSGLPDEPITIIILGDPNIDESDYVADPVADVVADGVDLSTLTLTMRDENANFMPVEDVFFEVDSGGGVLSAISGQTDSVGVISVELRSQVADTSKVSVYAGTDANGVFLGTVSVAFVAGTPHALEVDNQPENKNVKETMSEVSVKILDRFGNHVTDAVNSVTVSPGDGGYTFASGTLTSVATEGVATFDDLIIDDAGTDYTMSFASDSLEG
ncbi:MAG: hypothetical protein DA446_09110, partial [Bacteroidetes bacterium]